MLLLQELYSTLTGDYTVHSNPAQFRIEKKRPCSRLDGVQAPIPVLRLHTSTYSPPTMVYKNLFQTYNGIQAPIPGLQRHTSTFSQPTMVYRKLFRTYDGIQEQR